ncbi:hypothetical protein [Ruficoccus sp. ZRK36]|uniref:hypothetical protein n=1 Tax=Ruficoccus sp. ZRK36 TaxID=2866311 RepID=UPI001C73A324|nr:hypothetical protein [Ruficoccus sp. ZRK36]QYY37181.1 hypothetical protein K0V07_06775 [Ruficoccus sp. ZRK36]
MPKPTLLFLFLSVSLSIFQVKLHAQDPQALMDETHFTSTYLHRSHSVWWIPSAYWELSLRQESELTEREINEVLRIFDPYLLIIVIDAKINDDGTTNCSSLSEIWAKSELTVNGNLTSPIPTTKLSEDMRKMLKVFRPFLKNLLGRLGEGAQFLVYSNTEDTRIDSRLPGSITLKLGDETFRWRLPLGSLLPPKIDPKTDETFPGNYNFNPYTGDELTVEK